MREAGHGWGFATAPADVTKVTEEAHRVLED
jgi:hypothetical protein